jgi:hypothetical protein
MRRPREAAHTRLPYAVLCAPIGRGDDLGTVVAALAEAATGQHRGA